MLLRTDNLHLTATFVEYYEYDEQYCPFMYFTKNQC